MSDERWKSVPGFDDRYAASDMGRVKSNLTGHFIAIGETDGYPQVRLAGRTYKLHRVVLMTFVGPRPHGTQACHRNGVRLDCTLSNLRYGTPASNSADKVTHGTASHHPRKLISADVERIRESLLFGALRIDLARTYNVARNTIAGVANKIHWRHL